MYVKNVRRWLVPFLMRCERQKPGSFKSLIREYTINMAKGDLGRCLMIFQTSKADVSLELQGKSGVEWFGCSARSHYFSLMRPWWLRAAAAFYLCSFSNQIQSYPTNSSWCPWRWIVSTRAKGNPKTRMFSSFGCDSLRLTFLLNRTARLTKSLNVFLQQWSAQQRFRNSWMSATKRVRVSKYLCFVVKFVWMGNDLKPVHFQGCVRKLVQTTQHGGWAGGTPCRCRNSRE